jgi:hypothetical protein
MIGQALRFVQAQVRAQHGDDLKISGKRHGFRQIGKRKEPYFKSVVTRLKRSTYTAGEKRDDGVVSIRSQKGRSSQEHTLDLNPKTSLLLGFAYSRVGNVLIPADVATG